MSDASEVKRWKAGKPFFMWTYDEAMSCVEKRPDEIEVILASDHDRIVAELKAEIERLKRANQVVPKDAELLALNGKFRDTIARQAKVIEKLREQRERYAKDMQEVCGTPNLYKRDEQELEAVEQGEEK